MPYSTSKQIFRVLFFSLVGGIIGLQFDAFWVGFGIALFVDAVSKIYFYNQLISWLAKGASTKLPLANDFWSTLMDHILKIIEALRSEKDLLQSNVEYFKESFQALNDAVIVIDQNGKIDWANTSANRLLGINIENDGGQSFNNLIRSPEVIEYLEKKPFGEPLSIISPKQVDSRLEIQATIFRHNLTLLFVRDITDLYKLDSMRRDFIANVSHELRTPLTVITGYLETLKVHGSELPSPWPNAIDQMQHQSKRMDLMVEDLIWLSRLESLPVDENKFETFNLYELLQAVTDEVKLSYPDKITQVLFSDSGSSSESEINKATMMLGNLKELRTVFSNLAQNAAKYTGEEGRIDILVYIEGQYLLVAFKDDGIGIDKKHLPRLTERFYRADDSRTTSTGGTGLGLAIVKHILVRHEAKLEITSQLGKGSTFSCYFPMKLFQPEE